MNMRQPHTFPGLWPFLERAGAGRDLRHLGRSATLWHAKQVQDALGQLPHLSRKDRPGLLEHVAAVRDALAATLEGIDLAVAETVAAVEASEARPGLFTAPPFVPTPPTPPRRRRPGPAQPALDPSESTRASHP